MAIDVLIIGAGITGSLCAAGLKRVLPCLNVTVWDKAGRPGGSMTTTSSDMGNIVDLGAQYISTTSNKKSTFCNEYLPLLDQGIITPLITTEITGIRSFSNDTEHFVAPKGMASIVNFFLDQSSSKVILNRHVSSINLNRKRYDVATKDGSTASFDIIVSTMPLKQFVSLESNVPLNEEINNVEYSSRFALIWFYDKPLQKVSDWVAKYVDDETFCYVAWDNLKRNAFEENSTLVLHTTTTFGRLNKSRSKVEVVQELSEKARLLFPDCPEPTQELCHKWLYSQVVIPFNGKTGCYELNSDPLLLIAGDAFTSSNFDGCIHSSRDTVNHIYKYVTKQFL